MDQNEYPPNSRAPKSARKEPEKKVVTQVTTGKVVTRRKPLLRRFAETFIAEDSQSVGRYILMDVLIPAARDLIADVINQGVERTLFGSGRQGRGRPGHRTSGGQVSYQRYSSGTGSSNPPWRRDDDRAPISQRARRNHDFDEIVLATRAEANEVIDRMFDLISRYEQVTVSDLYDLVGLESKFTDEKYGWTDIRGLEAVRVGGGYLLDLSKPEPLD